MKILVAVDPSWHTRHAIRFVKSVAWQKKSEIFLLHVVEIKDAPSLKPSGGPDSWERVISRARGQLMTEARLFLEQTQQEILQQSSFQIKSLVVEGFPGEKILQAAKDYRVNLVILGTRSLSNVQRFFLGSTSDCVLRNAQCSVLLVREKLSRGKMGKIAINILLANDGSADGLGSIQMIDLLGFKVAPKVTVTHVVCKPVYLEGWYWGREKAEFKQLAEQLLKKARKDGASHLEKISQRFKEIKMDVNTVLAKGDPADEILKTAERVNAKLIIVGSKRTKGGKPISSGEIVRKICHYAPCSVLVTRPESRKKED